jgi:hypothetical protein
MVVLDLMCQRLSVGQHYSRAAVEVEARSLVVLVLVVRRLVVLVAITQTEQPHQRTRHRAVAVAEITPALIVRVLVAAQVSSM